MLSDIFPTGWHGVVLADFVPGDRIAIFGAGPVGLMAAHSARIQGASEVFVVDQRADRLSLVADLDCTPVDFSAGDPVEQILDATDGLGTDCGVVAVGCQAHDPTGEEHPELVLDNLVQVVKAHGGIGIGVVGVYVPEDPAARNDLAKEGRIAWDYGTFFTKGQHMGTGQAPVKRYNRQLRDLIVTGRATPLFWSPTSWVSTRLRTATSTSTTAKTGGPRSCSAPGRQAEPFLTVVRTVAKRGLLAGRFLEWLPRPARSTRHADTATRKEREARAYGSPPSRTHAEQSRPVAATRLDC